MTKLPKKLGMLFLVDFFKEKNYEVFEVQQNISQHHNLSN